VGKGVVVTKKVVGVKDETDDLCDEDGLMLLGMEDIGAQLAKSVEIGLTAVMRLVMIRGPDIVVTPPMQPSI